MNSSLEKRPFRLDGALAVTPFHKLNVVIENTLERIFALKTLDSMYEQLAGITDSEEFLDRVLDAFHINYAFKAEEMAHLPKQGGCIIVANHPFGALEGVIMAHLLSHVRKDIKIMANLLLERIPQLRQYFISVNPFGGREARVGNALPLRECIRYVQKGGMLVVFPAGEVSHIQLSKGQVIDPEWSATVGRMVKMTKVPVIPIYFHGNNSLMFQMLGLIHPRLRTAMIPRELINKASSNIRVSIGSPISFSVVRDHRNDEAITRYLRLRTYMLRGVNEEAEQDKVKNNPPAISMSKVIDPIARDLLQKEVSLLPTTQCLVVSGTFQVFYAQSTQIHWLLREIGRLREITFREAGEGTGKSIDIDLYDSYYLHLFIWNQATQEVVGAYRMGLADEILARYGRRGLYTYSLFKYKQRVLDELNPSIELGRSFICGEYQRSFTPLLMLWRGLCQYVSRFPRYRVLFGPVSISNEYKMLSRHLLVDFLRTHSFQDSLARHVRPRKPFRGPSKPIWDGLDLAEMVDVEQLSQLVANIEGDDKGVPVLLKQYLKMGGRLLGFSVDKDFNNALDGLIMVDLRKSEPKLLARYMGAEEAQQYRAYHNLAAEPLKQAS